MREQKKRPCRECGKLLDPTFTKCFKCGADQRSFFARHFVIGIIIGVILSLLVGLVCGSVVFRIMHSNDDVVIGDGSEIEETINNESDVDDSVNVESIVLSEEDLAIQNMINIYAITMHLSKQKVKDNLLDDYPDVSESEIEYVLDNTSIDWTSNALYCAELYRNAGLSDDLIYDQLIDLDHEAFTVDEVTTAILRLNASSGVEEGVID